MWRAIAAHVGTCGLVTAALAGLAAFQDPQPSAPRPETQLRVQVLADAPPKAPIKGAAVYVEWKDGEETQTREGSTNSEGIAGPYKVLRARVFVQVTIDDSWQSYGENHDLQGEQQTVQVSLKKKSS
jgi:hypothetical protein